MYLSRKKTLIYAFISITYVISGSFLSAKSSKIPPLHSNVKLDDQLSSAVATDKEERPTTDANPENLPDQRKLFEEAESALKANNTKRFLELREKLKDYPLLPYLEREVLIDNLELDQNEKIATFLNQYTHQPVTRKLRYKWLYWLAERNHASAFLTHYQDSTSLPLKCYQLYFRLKTNEKIDDLAPEIEKIWLSSHSLPKSCDKLFALWHSQGGLDDSLIWRRTLLAASAGNRGLVKYLSKRLPASGKEATELLLKSLKKPEYLKKIKFKQPLTQRAIDIIDLSLNRLAWQDPEKTIGLWKHLGHQFNYETKSPKLKRAIALSLAIDKSPKALDWLNSVDHKNDQSVAQWILSTAIENQDWETVAKHTQSLAETDTSTHKWRYWQAVAETQLGNLTLAQTLFKSLSETRSYYGFLSARQLDKSPELGESPIHFKISELEQLEQHPAAIRAREFYALSRLPEARREWNYLVKLTPQSEQIKLAAIAHQWGWQHQAILAFARSKKIDDVSKRFPLEHFNTYQESAQQHNIPVTWAFAITRQESAFKTDARSSANARGLMQLRPSTARSVAKYDKHYKSPRQLYSPDTNIRLGTAHLSKMFAKFNQHPILATAAYNAGQTNVKKWLQRTKLTDPVQWIEQIPYKETREYVKNVLTYQLIYAQLTNQKEVFIDQLDALPILASNQPSTNSASK